MKSSGSGVYIQEIELYRLCASKVRPVVLRNAPAFEFLPVGGC
jgi:hypothetical protein